MSVEHSIPSQPPSELLFRPKLRVLAAVREVWRGRELVRTLNQRPGPTASQVPLRAGRSS